MIIIVFTEPWFLLHSICIGFQFGFDFLFDGAAIMFDGLLFHAAATVEHSKVRLIFRFLEAVYSVTDDSCEPMTSARDRNEVMRRNRWVGWGRI